MPSIDEVREWQGRTLVDRDGDRIGRIQDIYLDAETDEPEWALVNTGLFGLKSTFVPISQARAEGDEVHVPYEKAVIKDAPGIEPEGELSESEEARLYDHYGFGDTGAGAPADVGVAPGVAAAAARGGRGDLRDERAGEPEDRVYVDQDARALDRDTRDTRDTRDLPAAGVPGAGSDIYSTPGGPADVSGRGVGDERDEVVPTAAGADDRDSPDPAALTGGGGFGEAPVLSATAPGAGEHERDHSGPFGTGAAPVPAVHEHEAGTRDRRDDERDAGVAPAGGTAPARYDTADRGEAWERDPGLDDQQRAGRAGRAPAEGWERDPGLDDQERAGRERDLGDRGAGYGEPGYREPDLGGRGTAPAAGYGEPGHPGLARDEGAAARSASGGAPVAEPAPPPATDPAPPAERRRRLRRYVVTEEVIVNDRGEEEIVEVQREVPDDPQAPRG